MSAAAATLIAAFVIQAAPIVDKMALKGLQWLLDQMPGTNQENFLWGCHDVIAQIWDSAAQSGDPNASEAWKRAEAIEGIIFLARDMGVEVDVPLLRSLGLA